MSRIILAWELGANYGHLSQLLCVAQQLRNRGHQVLFAIKKTVAAEQLLNDEKFCYVTAPRSPLQKKRFKRPVSFADILGRAGFGCEPVLRELVVSWQKIFSEMSVDLIVAQYAPIAQFAARLSGLPCLTLSIGFEHPPTKSPYPSFPSYNLTKEKLMMKEAALLQNINSVSRQYGNHKYNRLFEVMKGDVDLLATLPEFDHYGHRRNGKYIGPISILDQGESMQWQEGKEHHIFVYMRPIRHIETILKVLSESGAEVIAHIPGLDEEILTLFNNKSLRIYTSRIKLSGLLEKMDLSITHGGHGTVSASLLAGVPVLTVPMTVEQWMLNRKIEALKLGVALKCDNNLSESLTKGLHKILFSEGYKNRAKNFAEKYSIYNQIEVISRMVNTIERLPARIKERNRSI